MKWKIAKSSIAVLAAALVVFFGIALAAGAGGRAGECGSGPCSPGRVFWVTLAAAALGLGSVGLLAFAVRVDPRQTGADEARPDPLFDYGDPEAEQRFRAQLLELSKALGTGSEAKLRALAKGDLREGNGAPGGLRT